MQLNSFNIYVYMLSYDTFQHIHIIILHVNIITLHVNINKLHDNTNILHNEIWYM